MTLDLYNLQIAMARKKMCRKDLVEETGLSEQTINAYFQGRVQPTLKSLGLIADVLSVDVTEIVKKKNET